MQESWHRYLRLGIVHFMAFPSVLRGEGPFVDTLRQIAQDEFFTAVETGWVHSDAERAAAAALLRESHVSVGFGAQSALLVTKSNLNALDESERKKAVALVQQCIDQAAQLGARRVAVLSGPYPGPSDEARATRLLVESLLDLCAYGRGRGIGITLETFDRTIEKKALAGPTRLCVEVSALQPLNRMSCLTMPIRDEVYPPLLSLAVHEMRTPASVVAGIAAPAEATMRQSTPFSAMRSPGLATICFPLA